LEIKMSVDLLPDSRVEGKKKKAKKSQLRVVLDTNALFVTPNSIGSASDLLRHEIANIISEAKYPDLDILWYLPEIVRHERQYQMQTEALKLRSAINKIERLLDHKLALSDRVLVDHVKIKIDEKESQLGLQEIKLDHALVDWPKLMHAAAYRHAPFEVGEKEKGFRDAIVAESFLQLLASSPKTASLCRVVLVTSDERLTQAVRERIADLPNASVVANVEELKGLINTIVSNAGEEFITQIKPKAAKLFFVSADDKETVFYKEKIEQRLEDKFKSELGATPTGTTFRKNGRWLIERPNFSKKDGRRVFWTSRISIEIEAGTVTKEEEPVSGMIRVSSYAPPSGSLWATPSEPITYYGYDEPGSPSQMNSLSNLIMSPSQKRVISHKGKDIFEVRWSTEVTMSKDLKKPVVDDIVHVELICQPIS
jgi:hypothetical protein